LQAHICLVPEHLVLLLAGKYRYNHSSFSVFFIVQLLLHRNSIRIALYFRGSQYSIMQTLLFIQS